MLVAVGGGRSIAVQPVKVRLVADVEHGGRASACMQFATQRPPCMMLRTQRTTNRGNARSVVRCSVISSVRDRIRRGEFG
ncbi:hypothetical protein WI88_33825 [Burkholderia ubonensis]|nr:hypothetical protein WI88_33825 [Burkholderia ubonensis]